MPTRETSTECSLESRSCPRAIQRQIVLLPDVAGHNVPLLKDISGSLVPENREKGNNNDLFGMNFGIHASIPDFNLDGVPEIGVGAVVSFLKDYVQAGWAFNLFEKTANSSNSLICSIRK